MAAFRCFGLGPRLAPLYESVTVQMQQQHKMSNFKYLNYMQTKRRKVLFLFNVEGPLLTFEHLPIMGTSEH